MIATIAITALCSIFTPSESENWPGWRGPGGNGLASGAPPIAWAEDKNVRWRTEIPGKGSSSPIVWGDFVFVTTAISVGEPAKAEDNQDSGGDPRGGGRSARGGWGGRGAPPVEHDFLVLALSRETGEVLWEVVANSSTPHQGTHRDGSYASPTPVTDGEVLIASFGSYGLFAFDYSGEQLWHKDLGDMDIAMAFGEGASPVLHGDLIIHPWDHSGDSFLVALDKRTGEEKWRVARETGTTWCTPMIVTGAKGPEVIMAAERTISYDLMTGKQLWAFGQVAEAGGRGAPRGGTGERDGSGGSSGDAHGDDGGDADEQDERPRFLQQGGGQGGRSGGQGGRRGGGVRSGVMSSPVVHGGVLLMSTGGRRGSFQAIDISKASGELDTEGEALLWSSEGNTPNVPSPIAFDGVFYSLKSNSGILSAFDVRTGEMYYGPQRLSDLANAYASPVIAGGHLYFAGRDGTCEVVKTGKKFESVAVNTLDDEFDASPAIVGNELFLRGRTNLYCIAAGE